MSGTGSRLKNTSTGLSPSWTSSLQLITPATLQIAALMHKPQAASLSNHTLDSTASYHTAHYHSWYEVAALYTARSAENTCTSPHLLMTNTAECELWCGSNRWHIATRAAHTVRKAAVGRKQSANVEQMLRTWLAIPAHKRAALVTNMLSCTPQLAPCRYSQAHRLLAAGHIVRHTKGTGHKGLLLLLTACGV
jgi:hypothetical protein